MRLYLNPPRLFWGIQHTEIIISRQAPLVDVDDEMLEELDTEERAMFDKAIEDGVVTVVSDDFEAGGDTQIEYILNGRIADIHSKYITKFLQRGDLQMLKEMRRVEGSKEKPRSRLMTLIDRAISHVDANEKLQEGLYEAIDYEEEEIEEIEETW